MVAKKAPKTTRKKVTGPSPEVIPHWVGVFKEHVSSEMTAFAEGMGGKIEQLERRIDRRFESVERQLGLLTGAVRAHSKALESVEAKLDKHEERLDKLEGAAE